MYPYYPQQVQGLLQAIKGAAEYELLVNDWVRRDRFAEMLARFGVEGVQTDSLGSLPSTVEEIDGWVKGEQEGGVLDSSQASGIRDLSAERKAELVSLASTPEPGLFLEAQKRMGPQLSAHILMLLLIVLGNLTYFVTRRRGGGR